MKALSYTLFLFISVGLYGQSRILSPFGFRSGYEIQNWSIDPTYTGYNYYMSRTEPLPPLGTPVESEENTVRMTEIPIIFENLGEHFYSYFSATGTVNGLTDLMRSWNSNTYTMGSTNNIQVNRTELIEMRFAYGHWLNERIGLYGGVQYSYDRLRLTYRLGGVDPGELVLGGNQRGVNGMAFVDLGVVYLKGLVMLDQVIHSGGESKGYAQTFTGELYYPFNHENNMGAFVGITRKMTHSPGPEGIPAEGDWANRSIPLYATLGSGANTTVEPFQYDLPDVTGVMTAINFGLYIYL